ncbi:MFS transporter [Lysinibacillus louembei]|uniref:MFS transporter n=1 Tax=Lysinibacillus louembei TaxID=1470088 RepID=A0ABZ0RS70_9BACI|nr:MFS transporter [Lysinibacillus louembei]WPK11083.1 MFS transporter [Lysinibacillus louembei]
MWKNKNVWIVLIGEFVVGLGLWAGIIGNLAFMQETVPSDFHKSLILALGMIAGVAVGPLAGRIIDSSSKKKVLIVASAGRVVSVLFMFVALATNSVIWMLCFLVSLQLAAAFYMPALQAVIPMIVKDRDLITLNGWHMNARTISRIIGTAAAGLVLSYFDVKWLYIASMVMYIVMLGITFTLDLQEQTKEKQTKEKSKGSFKEVYPMLKEQPVVLMTLVLMVIPILFLGSFNLVIMKITEIHQSQSLSGMIYAVEGTAFMLGAVFIKHLTKIAKTGTILFMSVFIIGLMELMLFLSDIQLFALLTFALFGFTVGCFFPTTMTIFQRQVPKEYHGRFFSFRNMLDQVLFQIVLLSTGALLDLIGLQWMGVTFGVFSLLLSSYFLFIIRRRKLEMAM